MKAGIKQGELSALSGQWQTTISAFERGLVPQVKLAFIESYKAALITLLKEHAAAGDARAKAALAELEG